MATKKKKNFLLLKTTLSAILFSFSFIFINQLGFLVVPSFLILYLVFRKNDLINISFHGFLWGGLALGLHFIWLYDLLLYKSSASILFATALYLFIVFYSGLLGIIFFNINKLLFNLSNKFFAQITFFILTISSFFYLIEKNFLFFIEKDFGYPFLNPLIPLANYKIFLVFYGLLFNVFVKKQETSLNEFYGKNKIVYLKPVVNSFDCKYNSTTVAQLIYKQLAELNLHEKAKKGKRLIIVSPESFYPFALNKNKKAIKLWSSVLPGNSTLFICGQREEKGEKGFKIFQTVYMLETGRIIDFYDKKHRVLFVEKIPNNLKKINWSKKLFLCGKNKFKAGLQNNKLFILPDRQVIAPQICSEFFYLLMILGSCHILKI
jgi:apolipoprotein N-acyltransferase